VMQSGITDRTDDAIRSSVLRINPFFSPKVRFTVVKSDMFVSYSHKRGFDGLKLRG
jgi:hypothetical protein